MFLSAWYDGKECHYTLSLWSDIFLMEKHHIIISTHTVWYLSYNGIVAPKTEDIISVKPISHPRSPLWCSDILLMDSDILIAIYVPVCLVIIMLICVPLSEEGSVTTLLLGCDIFARCKWSGGGSEYIGIFPVFSLYGYRLHDSYLWDSLQSITVLSFSFRSICCMTLCV